MHSHSEWSETRRSFITIAFQLSFRIRRQEGKESKESLELNGTHQLLVHTDDGTLLGETKKS
jgi:hypothetical protein